MIGVNPLIVTFNAAVMIPIKRKIRTPVFQEDYDIV